MTELTENRRQDELLHIEAMKRLQEDGIQIETPQEVPAKAQKIINLEERKVLLDQICVHLQEIGVSQEKIDVFLSLDHSNATLKRIKLPTKEEWLKYASMPHNLKTLTKMPLPLLYNWTIEEIIDAMSPYIGNNAAKYRTTRCDFDECKVNGQYGVWLALKTDAGLSPFAGHAFNRIRTCIRRPSAESALIREPEKMPSKTEVRIAITTWLQGKVDEFEMDRIAQSMGYDSFDAINNTNKSIEIMDLAAGRIMNLNKKMNLNMEMLITSKDLEFCKIQKKTQTWEKENPEDPENPIRIFRAHKKHQIYLIRNSFRLDRLDFETKCDLIDYLSYRFQYSGNTGKSINKEICPEIKKWHKTKESEYWTGEAYTDTLKFQTVGDLVQKMAGSPDFHNNPVGFTTADDGGSLDEYLEDSMASNPYTNVEDADRKAIISKIVKNILSTVELSDNQKVVRDLRFGLNGKEAISGSVLADNFGFYTGKGTKVSRQRIAQYEKALTGKYLEAAWDTILDDPKFYKLMATARKISNLTKEEDMILKHAFGLDKVRIQELEFIADNYEKLVGDELSGTQTDRRAHIRTKLVDIKKKILQSIL